MNENTLYVTDEQGNEVEMEILFTFKSEDETKKYVVYKEANNDEASDVYASIYDEDGNLLPIETDEEWNMVEEVLGAFLGEE